MRKDLLKTTTNVKVKIEKGSNRYHLSSFPIVLQVFAYDILPELGQRYARNLDVDLFSQMLCWTIDRESKIFNEDLRNYIFLNPDVSKFFSLGHKSSFILIYLMLS